MFVDAYRAQIAERQHVPDPAQQQAVEQFQQVFDHLTRHSRAKAILQDRLVRLKWGKGQTTACGLWLWGSVGSGKTYLMDLFFHALPIRQKRRLHFHRLMRHVHLQLKKLKDRRNPLDVIAGHLAKRYKVICLDEFFVSDVADAMILAALLQGLFERNVTLIATSNTHPDCLYEGGLQRERFMPAIALIHKYMTVSELSAACDYRLQHLDQSQTYCLNTNGSAERILEDHFEHWASASVRENTTIEVEGRHIAVRQLSHDAIWFDFEALCTSPRSVHDYIAIGRCFHTILISDIPIFTSEMEDDARRFIEMIDEFYDRNVTLIVSAQAEPNELYQGKRLKREFERTASRLYEMRSHNYWMRDHQVH